jgi:RecB family exonuclease
MAITLPDEMAIRLPQLQRISPSSADQLQRCPWAWWQQRIHRAGRQPQSRPMIRGTVFHEVVEQVLRAWAYGGAEITPDLVGYALGEAAAGRLTDAEIRELGGACKWLAPPCIREDVVLIEECDRSSEIPAPSPRWMPVGVDGFTVWGIVDMVYIDGNGHPVVLDWKTGYRPRDPEGYAPGIYAAMLIAHWPHLVDGDLEWPIRVVHRYVMRGTSMGTRERAMWPEDIDRDIAQLEGLVHRAQEWADAETWPAQENEYCASCCFMPWNAASGSPLCPQWVDHYEAASVSEMAREWLRCDAERKAAEQRQRALAEHLAAAALAGERVVYPDGMMLDVVRDRTVRWSLNGSKDVKPWLDACDAAGVDGIGLLTINGKAAGELQLDYDPEFAAFRTPADEARVRVERVTA